MAERKPFLLRVDPAVLEAVQRWANDDLRSLNAQIEFLLRRAVQQAGRDEGAKRRSKPDPSEATSRSPIRAAQPSTAPRTRRTASDLQRVYLGL